MSKNKEVINKRITILIWTAIIACTMSFFGFVYEQIDFIPNYLGATPIEAKMHWNNFHSITNPAYYHIPASIIAICCIAVIWYYRQYLTKTQIRKLRVVSLLTILVNVLTGIAVTQINDKLYFGTQIDNSETIKSLAIVWGVLNFIRLSFVAICAVLLVKMFSISLITVEGKK